MLIATWSCSQLVQLQHHDSLVQLQHHDSQTASTTCTRPTRLDRGCTPKTPRLSWSCAQHVGQDLHAQSVGTSTGAGQSSGARAPESLIRHEPAVKSEHKHEHKHDHRTAERKQKEAEDGRGFTPYDPVFVVCCFCSALLRGFLRVQPL